MKPENHMCQSPALSDGYEPWTCTKCGRSFSGTVMPKTYHSTTDPSHFGEYAEIVIGMLVVCFLGMMIGLNLR